MQWRNRLLMIVTLTGLPETAAGQACDSTTVAFVNARVLTMVDSVVRPAQTVVVRGGRIVSVGSGSPPARACRVEAAGRTLLPGLVDVHAHVTERDLRLFLANGITTVREMNGSPVHVQLRSRIENGEIAGPRLIVSSPLLAGTPLRYRHRLIVSADDARRAAAEASAAGYEFLKVYDGLTAEQYEALAAAGKSVGLRLDGHVPAAVGLERAIAAGQAIQHMDKIAGALDQSRPDSLRLAEARRLFSGKGVWVTPTLASLRILDRAGTAEYAGRFRRPEMAYVDSESVAWWRSLVGSGNRPVTDSRFYSFQVALLRTLRESGARFLIGTDAANPMMIAGFSLHEEMETLVRDGGFSAFEVLVAATRSAADFFGDSASGRVQAGARADLLLVDGNPLADLGALRRPFGVMAGGRWLSRGTLDRMLAP